jgi:hypothetical protein
MFFPLNSFFPQGDQIGRIFAKWVTVYFFGQIKKIKKCCPLFGLLFHDYGYALILTKNGLGYILDDFFINSSGHSAFPHTPKISSAH